MTGSRTRMTHPAVRCGAISMLLSLSGLLVIAESSLSQVPPAAPPQPPPQVPQPGTDPVGQIIADARASFARVRDYMGTLVKQERVNAQLQPEQFIAMRVRQQPFSVHLKWQGPRQFVGQEAAYVAGKNNGQMRAKGSGLISVVGVISLDPTDPRALKQSRHAITESGIGNLIEKIARGHDANGGLPPGHVKVTLREYQFQQKPCIGLETVHLVNTGQTYCHRSLVLFDKELKMPVRFEAYDWPPAGQSAGELLECYSYIDLKFNVGLTDAAFGF
jgi:hypothetical protein